MNLYLLILKTLLKNELFFKYYQHLDLDFISNNYPEISRFFHVLPELHKDGNDHSLEDLYLTLLVAYPKLDEGFYNILFAQLKEMKVDETTVVSYLTSVKERQTAFKLAQCALKVSEGHGSWEELQGQFEAVKAPDLENEDWRKNFVPMFDFDSDPDDDKGLHWRLTSLNTALGPLRKGNFGFIFARPETGKTTFLSSEVTFMAAQGKEPVIWFNNEQKGTDVRDRIYQAAFSITSQVLKADYEHWKAKYKEEFAHLILNDDAGISRWEIEKICKHLQPKLIIFDQIDKIKGFTSDRYDLEMKEVYQWARELSKKYGPVIGVCQAGGSGEGKKWLSMNDVDSSKTAKQGEADYILGIGKTNEPGEEYLRFLHLSKNKLNGDENSDPRMRHGRWQVLIKPEIARYTEIGAG